MMKDEAEGHRTPDSGLSNSWNQRNQPTSHSMSALPVVILFANLKGNLGDLAILHAMLINIEKYFPSAPRIVYSLGHKNVDAMRLMRFLEQPHPVFQYKGPAPYHEIRRRWAFLKHLQLHRWLKGFLIDRLCARFASMEPFQSMGIYQKVFLAGGEQWGGFSAGINMVATVGAIYRFNQRITIFPFSIRQNVIDSYSFETLKSCFAKISGKVVLRDRLSAQSLRKVSDRIVEGVDCVFSLADCVPRNPSLEKSEDTILTIAVTEEKLGSTMEDLTDAIRRLKNQGIVVRLLTTCEEEDGRGLSKLGAMLEIDYIAPATWQEAVDELGKSTFVVTNRLHCMIFTFFADVPVVPLINREKVHGIFSDAGLDCHIMHLNELTLARVNDYKSRGNQIRVTMRGYLEKTQKHF